MWDDLAGQTTQTATNLVAGTYTVVVTDANGCIVASDPVEVTQPSGFGISVLLTPNNTTPPSGAIDFNITGGTPPFTYLWTGPGGPYMTEDLTGLTMGTYEIVATDANGCEFTNSYTVGGSVGIEDYNNDIEVNVYPNPSHGNFTVDFGTIESGKYTLELLNVIGQQMQRQELAINSGQQLNFNADGVHAGVYFLRITNEKQEQSLIRLSILR